MDDSTHLPALLSHIAGVPRSVVRKAIAQGEIKVSGKPWTNMDIDVTTLGEFDYIEHPWGDEVIERQRNGTFPT